MPGVTLVRNMNAHEIGYRKPMTMAVAMKT